MKKSFFKEYFQQFNVVFFDFDNTLTLESDYLFQVFQETISTFEEVGERIKEEMLVYLKSEFKEYGRDQLYNKFAFKYSLAEKDIIERFLQKHREGDIKQPLSIFPELASFIRDFLPDAALCVVTNGNPLQQRNKIRQTDFSVIDRSFHFIYANEWMPKPSPISISKYLNDYKSEKQVQPTALFIGDSWTDLLAAESAGCRFLHVSMILQLYSRTENIISA